MGRAPCCSKVGLHRGPWTAVEDELLINYIRAHGEGHWRSLPKKAGLLRCGKSCRLRWMNYLRPDIKRGNITPDEDDLIIRLHNLLGNRWSLIAGRLPGRTDNEIKNYWNSHLSKGLKNTSSSTKGSFFIREPRKRSTFKSNSDKKLKLNQHIANCEITKTKIHLPKAVRFSSVSVPRTCCASKESVLSNKAGSFGSTEVHNFPGERSSLEVGSVNNGEANLPCNEAHHHDLVYGYVSSCQNYIPTAEYNIPDEIFQEYEHLRRTDDDYTQLESFIDSPLL